MNLQLPLDSRRFCQSVCPSITPKERYKRRGTQSISLFLLHRICQLDQWIQQDYRYTYVYYFQLVCSYRQHFRLRPETTMTRKDHETKFQVCRTSGGPPLPDLHWRDLNDRNSGVWYKRAVWRSHMVYHFYSCRFFFVSSYLVWDLDLRLCSSSCSNILYDNWRINTGKHHHDLEERYWISNTIKQIHVSGYVCAHKEYIKEMSLTK